MTLESLGDVYLESAEKLGQQIAKKKKALETARQNGNGHEAMCLMSDICTLRQMKRECYMTGLYLKDYYRNSGRQEK